LLFLLLEEKEEVGIHENGHLEILVFYSKLISTDDSLYLNYEEMKETKEEECKPVVSRVGQPASQPLDLKK
jgi:hypothetical protein